MPIPRGDVLRQSQSKILRKYGLTLDKRLGQHFLNDANVLAKIADAVAQLEPLHVVELGSGAGALTFTLLDRGWPVRALELDSRMIALLEEERGDAALEIVRADLAKEDFCKHVGDTAMVFAGNLPYQVTSPVLFGLLPALARDTVRGAVLMMQAEVADRLAASHGGREYGVLSVLLQAQLTVERLFTVRPGSFLPPPSVDSAVVRVRRRANPIELGEDGRQLVKGLFQQRRKQIGGLLRRSHDLNVDEVATICSDVGLVPTQRPESISVSAFADLARRLRSRTA